MNMNMIRRQDAAIAAAQAPRTSAKRQEKLVRSVLRKFRAQSELVGYGKEEIDQQVRDIRDMLALEAICADNQDD